MRDGRDGCAVPRDYINLNLGLHEGIDGMINTMGHDVSTMQCL